MSSPVHSPFPPLSYLESFWYSPGPSQSGGQRARHREAGTWNMVLGSLCLSCHVLCDPPRRQRNKRPHCEWAGLWLGCLTRRENKELSWGPQRISREISLIYSLTHLVFQGFNRCRSPSYYMPRTVLYAVAIRQRWKENNISFRCSQ